MKKTLLTILCISLIATSAAGCGDISSSSSGSNAQTTAASQKTTTATPTTVAETTVASGEGTLGDYVVAIKAIRKSKDYKNKPAIIVTYEFTNNSEKATAFIFALSDKAFQDGIELESAIIGNDKSYNSGDTMKEIKTGKTITCEEAFLLGDETTPVEIEVGEFISWNDTKVCKTFELK